MKHLLLTISLTLLLASTCFAQVTFDIDNRNPKVNTAKVEVQTTKICQIVPKLAGLEATDLHITICIAKDKQEFRQVLPKDQKETPKAYYIRITKTLHFYKYDAYVFAHELTHALVDEYIGGKLPEKIREVIPTYIETKVRDVY